MSKRIQSADVGALPADATDTDRIRRYEAEIRKQLTPVESDYLFGNFEVIAKNKRDISQSGSNFDATVWRGRIGTPYAGEVHISLRPTQALPDGSYLVPDIDAYECAYNQVRDMYNWWMRVSAKPGDLVQQIELDIAGRPPLADLFIFVTDTPAIATGELHELVNPIDGPDLSDPTGDAANKKAQRVLP